MAVSRPGTWNALQEPVRTCQRSNASESVLETGLMQHLHVGNRGERKPRTLLRGQERLDDLNVFGA